MEKLDDDKCGVFVVCPPTFCLQLSKKGAKFASCRSTANRKDDSQLWGEPTPPPFNNFTNFENDDFFNEFAKLDDKVYSDIGLYLNSLK